MLKTNKNTSKDGHKKSQIEEMAFWDHAGVLRNVLIKISIVISVCTVLLFYFMNDIFDNIILAPCHADFPLYRLFSHITSYSDLLPDFSNSGFEVNLININLASQFFIHISTSFWLSLILSTPVVLYFLWGFVSPGLYPKERNGAKNALLMGNVMFYIGVAIGYFLVFPLTLRFLSEYHVSELVPNQISLDSYMDNFLGLIFIMGLIFELPLVCWGMGRIGILSRDFFSKYRRHAIVLLLIAAAFITPTGDPFTLTIVFMPIYMLWEASSLLVKPGSKPAKEPVLD